MSYHMMGKRLIKEKYSEGIKYWILLVIKSIETFNF